MKELYLDSEYMCHLEDDGTRLYYSTDVFDETADAAIPYYRLIPDGMSWRNPKTGRQYVGPFIQATNSQKIMQVTQEALIADMQSALAVLGVTE